MGLQLIIFLKGFGLFDDLLSPEMGFLVRRGPGGALHNALLMLPKGGAWFRNRTVSRW